MSDTANRPKNRQNPPPVAHQFKKGQSGNPSGRPKKRPITDEYLLILRSPLPPRKQRELGLPKGATYGQALALGTIRAAIRGRHGAAKEVREAIEGKSTVRLELTGESGGPVETKNADISETLAAIREIYGLSDRSPTGDDTGSTTPGDEAVPVPDQMVEGQESKKASEQK